MMFGKWTVSQSLIAADNVQGILSFGVFSYRNFQQVFFVSLALMIVNPAGTYLVPFVSVFKIYIKE